MSDLSQKVRVYNDHNQTYKEVFKNTEVVIPAGGHVVMERSDAIQFMSTYTPVIRDAQKRDLFPKKLKIAEAKDGDEILWVGKANESAGLEKIIGNLGKQ